MLGNLTFLMYEMKAEIGLEKYSNILLLCLENV